MLAAQEGEGGEVGEGRGPGGEDSVGDARGVEDLDAAQLGEGGNDPGSQGGDGGGVGEAEGGEGGVGGGGEGGEEGFRPVGRGDEGEVDGVQARELEKAMVGVREVGWAKGANDAGGGMVE